MGEEYSETELPQIVQDFQIERAKRSRSASDGELNRTFLRRKTEDCAEDPDECGFSAHHAIANPEWTIFEDPLQKANRLPFCLGWFISYVADVYAIFRTTLLELATFDPNVAFQFLPSIPRRIQPNQQTEEAFRNALIQTCMAIKFPSCNTHCDEIRPIDNETRAFYNVCEVSLFSLADSDKNYSGQDIANEEGFLPDKTVGTHALLICDSQNPKVPEGFRQIETPFGWCLDGTQCAVFAQSGFVENFAHAMSLHSMRSLTLSLDKLQLNAESAENAKSTTSNTGTASLPPEGPLLVCFESPTRDGNERKLCDHHIPENSNGESIIKHVYLDKKMLPAAAVLGEFFKEEALSAFLSAHDSGETLRPSALHRMSQLYNPPIDVSWARLKPYIGNASKQSEASLLSSLPPWSLGLMLLVFSHPDGISDVTQKEKIAAQRSNYRRTMSRWVGRFEELYCKREFVRCDLQPRTNLQFQAIFTFDDAEHAWELQAGREGGPESHAMTSSHRNPYWCPWNSLGISFLNLKYCK